MQDPNIISKRGRQRFSVRDLVLVVIGIVIGAILITIINAFSNDATSDPATQRWYVWEGEGPLFGDVYESEYECETARKAHLMGELASSTSKSPLLPTDAAEEEKLEKAQRAYCRTLP